MLFPTIDFAIFFAIVFTVNWLLSPNSGSWKIFMVAASYFFYAWTDWRFIFLLAASTLISFGGAAVLHGLEGQTKRLALWATLSLLLGLLAWFKYYVFFTVNVDNFCHYIGIGRPLPLLNVHLPIAISFFTFMAISYVVDVYRGALKTSRLLDLAVYLSFFPHLIAGPIVRGTELLPQIRLRRVAGDADYADAFWLIAAGLAKKVVLSSYLATHVVDPVFASPRQHSGPEIVFAVWGYAVQIYADFSGYTDIAIGVALLLGFHFPQNFNRPYTATSLQDFWRRWHMTLSNWLRDYLYIPLGGNRGTEWKISVNILITMLLGGLWHGAAWTFIGWGLFHGIGQIVGRQRRRWRTAHGQPLEPSGRVRIAVAQIVTFQLVCVGWLLFRATSFSNAWSMAGRLFHGWGTAPLVTPLAALAIVAGIATQFLPGRWLESVKKAFIDRRPIVQGGILGLVLLAITNLGPPGVAPFIYYRF